MINDIKTAFQNIVVSAQWHAFDTVLHWINEQEDKMISKGDLYDAVMDMRPDCYVESDISYEKLNAMTREQLIGKAMRLHKRIDRLEEWQLDVLELNSNIGLDVDRIQAIKMKEHFDNLSGASGRNTHETS